MSFNNKVNYFFKYIENKTTKEYQSTLLNELFSIIEYDNSGNPTASSLIKFYFKFKQIDKRLHFSTLFEYSLINYELLYNDGVIKFYNFVKNNIPYCFKPERLFNIKKNNDIIFEISAFYEPCRYKGHDLNEIFDMVFFNE